MSEHPHVEPEEGRFPLLIIDLAEYAITCANDCEVLYDEIQSIAEDYPEYQAIVFKIPYGAS